MPMGSNWVGLINELNDASYMLDSAMNQYGVACANILNHYKSGSNAAQGFVDSALTELTRLAAYESRFEQAKALLRRIRNQSPDLVPINALPPEVMARIFWFFRSSDHYCLSIDYDHQPDNRFVCPDVLLSVCSRWRQIVFASHDLWSHVDIDACQTSQLSRKLFLRAENFVAQSSQVLLDLHLRAGHSRAEDNRTLNEFFRSIAPRIQVFSLECTNGWLYPGREQPLFDTLLSRLLPGTLTQLHMHGQWPAFLAPINSTLSGGRSGSIVISIAEQQFEELLAPVTSLNLKDIYPFWTSRAYCGLVELTLGGREYSDIGIMDFELASILQASPALQIFRLGLRMRSSQVDPPIFIQLNSLELLELTTQRRFCLGEVLRMIHPGQIPLEISIAINQNFDLQSPYWAEFVGFASRSGIHRLRIHGQLEGFAQDGLHFHSSELFSSLPQLKELVLKGLVLGQRCEDLLGGYDAISILSMLQDAPRHRLRLLELADCTVHWNDFRHMSEMQPTNKLLIHRCEVIRTIPRIRRISKMVGSPYDWEGDLKKVCPVVEISNTDARYEDPRRDGYYQPSAPADDDM